LNGEQIRTKLAKLLEFGSLDEQDEAQGQAYAD